MSTGTGRESRRVAILFRVTNSRSMKDRLRLSIHQRRRTECLSGVRWCDVRCQRSRELSEGEEDPAMVKCRGRRVSFPPGARENKCSGGSECTGGGSGTTTIGGAVVFISLSTASTENRLWCASEGVTFTRWQTPKPGSVSATSPCDPDACSSLCPQPQEIFPECNHLFQLIYLRLHLPDVESGGAILRPVPWLLASPTYVGRGHFARDSEPRPVP